MKGLKIFGWICLGLALLSFVLSFIYTNHGWNDDLLWRLSALAFFLASILSLLIVRGLKELQEQLELKILMSK